MAVIANPTDLTGASKEISTRTPRETASTTAAPMSTAAAFATQAVLGVSMIRSAATAAATAASRAWIVKIFTRR
jgi:hypothetical protein